MLSEERRAESQGYSFNNESMAGKMESGDERTIDTLVDCRSSSRRHGEASFYITQFPTGHGCFHA